MRRIWTSPGGTAHKLYLDMLRQTHLLIAGATGSGKSTVVNNIIQSAMLYNPSEIQFILIDHKGTELSQYARLPHTIAYAQENKDCIKALEQALAIVRQRFDIMKRKRLDSFDGSHIYVIIDELMFFMNRRETKAKAMNLLQDILVIARASRVHVIACTQSPTEKTGLPVNLRCNFDSRVALRTSTAQDSRNIIGVKGCELFPNPPIDHEAKAVYMHSGMMETYDLPQLDKQKTAALLDYWNHHRKPKLVWH